MITAGEVIKNKRESLGKKLDTVSTDTKIQKRYLEYIENNEFDRFDSDIFASGFLKIYSKYLNLDEEKVLALYRRSRLPVVKTDKKNPKIKPKQEKFKISPKLISIITISIFLLLIVGYIGFQIYKFQKPPFLTVSQPANEFVSQEDMLTVQGETEKTSLLDINGTQVEVEDDGSFQTEITLKEGVNTVTVKAWKESNTKLQTAITLKVIYEPKDEIAQEQEVKEYLLTLSITQSPSWIKLDVDGENKISQVLQPNTQHQYEVLTEFTLVTGRVQNTNLTVNNESIPISSSSTTGIGQITCKIESNELKCE